MTEIQASERPAWLIALIIAAVSLTITGMMLAIPAIVETWR